MFLPIVPDIGVDIDQIMLVEKAEQELTAARMKEQLIVFSKALFAGNEAWGKWGQIHPEDIPRYHVWFRTAGPLQSQVIPSMAFDFVLMSPGHVRARFLMIEDQTKRLLLDVPSEMEI